MTLGPLCKGSANFAARYHKKGFDILRHIYSISITKYFSVQRLKAHKLEGDKNLSILKLSL